MNLTAKAKMNNFSRFLVRISVSFVMVAVPVAVPVGAGAETLYSYSRLILKDLDQMNKLVREKIKESRKSSDKQGPLREAMQAVYSRPNEDFMIEKIIGPIKSELDEIEGWEGTMKSIVDEAIRNLKEPDKIKSEAQITYAIFLENIMGELKPDAEKPFEKSIMTQIRDAKIKLSPDANKERSLRVMKKVKSPSDIAEMILTEVAKAEKLAAQAKASEDNDARDAVKARKKTEEKK